MSILKLSSKDSAGAFILTCSVFIIPYCLFTLIIYGFELMEASEIVFDKQFWNAMLDLSVLIAIISFMLRMTSTRIREFKFLNIIMAVAFSIMLVIGFVIFTL
jgi:hypothetical protein